MDRRVTAFADLEYCNPKLSVAGDPPFTSISSNNRVQTRKAEGHGQANRIENVIGQKRDICCQLL